MWYYQCLWESSEIMHQYGRCSVAFLGVFSCLQENPKFLLSKICRRTHLLGEIQTSPKGNEETWQKTQGYLKGKCQHLPVRAFLSSGKADTSLQQHRPSQQQRCLPLGLHSPLEVMLRSPLTQVESRPILRVPPFPLGRGWCPHEFVPDCGSGAVISKLAQGNWLALGLFLGWHPFSS